MTALSRRAALGLAGGAAVTALFGARACARTDSAAGAAAQDGPAFVRNDIGTLRHVLVHSPVMEDYAVEREGGGLVPSLSTHWPDYVAQHGHLTRHLRETGAEVLELADALQGAIDAARASGSFEAWLSGVHPRLSGDADAVTAATLLGRDPARQYRLRDIGGYRHDVSDSSSTMWTRDASFMTPNGLVVCNSLSPRRLRENMTLRFALMHAPQLADYPVVFDAVAEGVILEGGDAQMVAPDTLFLGVGQRSDPRAAPMLARRLNMDVLAVHIHQSEYLTRHQTPMGGGAQAGLRVLFLHLDTFFTHVADRHVLCVPWFLEHAHAGEDPLSEYIRGARAETTISDGDASAALDFLKDFGKITLFRAGTGAKEELEDMKLVDYVRARGYRVTPVGGRAPEAGQDAFTAFMRDTLGEMRRQASNVVATAPGRVLAYDGSPLTQAALERDGIEVTTFPARELWANFGGPHCLTMPLRRG